MPALVNREYERDLGPFVAPTQAFLGGLEECFVARSNTSTVYRIPWRLAGADTAVYLKRFRNRDLLHALWSILRPTRARVSWDGCAGLLERGFRAAEPLVCHETRRLGVLSDPTFFLCREVPGARPWRSLLCRDATARAALLAHTGEWIGRLHEAGIDHRAIQPKNILVTGEDPASCELYAIEYNRIRIRGRVRPAARIRALRLMLRDLAGSLSREEVDSFLEAYLRGSGEGDLAALRRRLGRVLLGG
ncbi:MAG: hypothetical protein HY720_13840 [Planctomycetes bacterium]|nr:hypothetical protein [Planctomycetota bacterium]